MALIPLPSGDGLFQTYEEPMDDEFSTDLDTSLGDDSSNLPGLDDTGGGSTSLGMTDALAGAATSIFHPVGLPAIRGGLRGNPGALALGGGAMYGGGRILGRGVGKLWEMAKRFGPDLAAGAAGMTAEQLMSVFLDRQPWRHRRRRRGISARDVRTTRRVVNFVSRISHQIGCVHTPRYRAAHHRRAK